MYPQRELNRLAAHKAVVRRTITRRRGECAAAATRLTQPLAWADRALALARQLAPFAALPLALLAQRLFFPRRKIFGALLRWAPLIATAARLLRARFPFPAPAAPSVGQPQN